MKRICYMVLLLSILGRGPAVSAAGLLTGVTRLSCEALLCLSSPARPAACNPALSYYFGIKKVTWPATFAARLRFLNKCPTASPGLARSVAKGAPRKWKDMPVTRAWTHERPHRWKDMPVTGVGTPEQPRKWKDVPVTRAGTSE